jgi:alcohol dehydrogenase
MVPREVLPDIARAALSDGASIYNPEDTDYDDNLMVLEAAWEGKPLDRNQVKKG